MKVLLIGGTGTISSAITEQLSRDNDCLLYTSTINYVTIAQTDLPQKIQTTLASGAQMPDVIQLEATTRGKMFALDCWENFSEAPYNVDKNIFTIDQLPVSVDENGNLLGLPMGSVPSLSLIHI